MIEPVEELNAALSEGAVEEELAAIIEEAGVQELMDDLYSLTRLPLAILDVKGKVLVAKGWQDVCTKFHRVHPESSRNCIDSDTELSSGVEPGQWKIYRCKNGLWDIATPIMIGEQHAGNLFLGQLLLDDEAVDRDRFRAQARRYGFDEAAYLEALDRVPHCSRKEVETAMRFYARLADMISRLGHSKRVTEQALARQQESERRYRELAESLPEMVYEVDENGRVSYVNKVALAKWGYTKEDIAAGLLAVDMFIPEDRQRIYDNIVKLSRGEHTGRAEYTALCKDGRRFPVLIHSNAVTDEHKQMRGFRGIIIDQTLLHQQRQWDQLALRVQARLLRGGRKRDIIRDVLEDIQKTVDVEAVALRLQEGADYPYYETTGFNVEFVEAERSLCACNDVGSVMYDEQGTVLLECMCGNVIQGRTDPALPFFTKYGSFWTNSTTDLLASTTEEDRQARTRNRCHGEGYESVALIPLTGFDGNIGLLQLNDTRRDRFSVALVTAMESIARHIGEGLERMLAQEALQVSENKLRAIMDNTPDFVLHLGLNMEVLWANKIAHDSVPGLLSMSCSEAFIGTRESCPGCPCLRALRTGRIERQVMHHTEAQGAPGGESFWDTIGVPIRNDEGEITSVLEIARNITEIKQTERALEQALDRAQAASRAKSAFLANMSHELRTPLNPVIGFTDLLLSDDDLSSEQRECLELVNRRGHDLLQLLNDILDIARIEAERMVITPEPTDLGVLLGDVVELFCHPLEGKAVTIRTSMADRVPTTVFVDPLRLRQVLINLVGNAVKFTEQGYIDIGVDILEEEALDNGERGGLRLQFEVRDTGIGISEEHQAVIFSTFTQADDSFTREYGGAGLGLAICRRLTQLMGGDIQVVSKPGKGSVFTFFIQTKSCSEAIASLDSLNDDALVLPKGFTVLLAEDDPASKVLTERLLTRAGGQCECVRSGQQAVKACREKTYDAVLMDIKMPDMDGLTATRLIRAQERAGNRHMPIIAMTAFAFEEDRRACLVAGMDAVLTKPVSASALREQLAQWIALSSGEAGS